MADDDIDIKVSLRDEASRPARRVADGFDKVDRNAISAAAAVNELEKQIQQEGRAAMKAAAENEALAKSEKKVGQEADSAGRKSGGGSKGVNKMTKAMKEGSKAGGILFKVLKYGIAGGAILDGVGNLAAMLNGVAAGGIAAVSGLAPLSGLLAAYPGMLAAIGQGYGVSKLAFSGLGEAFKEMTAAKSDPKKLAASLKGVTKEGKSFLTYLVGLRKDWKGLQADAQKGMLPGVEKGLRSLVKTGMPQLRKMVKATSKDLGVAATDFGHIVGSGSNMKMLGRIFASNGKILSGTGKDAGHLFGILLDVLDAARPMMQAMAKDAGAFLAKWDKAMSTGKNKKGLTEFLSNSYSLFKKVVAVTKDFGTGLINIFKGSVPMSQHMGKNIATIADNFSKWSSSEKGRKEIADFFKDMEPIFDETVHLIWDIAKAFVGLGRDTKTLENLHSLRTELLPALVDLSKQASGKFIPAIIDIVTQLGHILEKADAFTPLSAGLSATSDLLKIVAGIFDKLPHSISTAIVTFAAFTGLARKMDIASKLTGINTAFTNLANSSGGGGIKGATRGVGNFITKIGLKGGAGLLGVLGGPWGIAFAGAATILGHFIGKSQEAKQAQDDFRASLDQATGAVTDQGRAIMGKQLQDKGAFKTADKYGIDRGTLINAATGDKKSADIITAQYQRIYTNYLKMVTATRDPKNTPAENLKLDQVQKDAQVGLVGLNKMLDGIIDTGAASRSASKDTKQLADAVTSAGKQSNMTAAQVAALNGDYSKIPAQKKTFVNAPGVENATGKVQGFKSAIFSVPNRKNVTISVGGTATSIQQIINLQKSIDSLKGKTVGVRYVQEGNVNGGRNTGGGQVASNADGGWVGAGTLSHVNERGQEAFWDRATGRLSALGTGTPWETVAFDRPGYVVPNEVLRGVRSAAGIPTAVMDAVRAARPSGGAGGPSDPLPLPPVTVKVGSVRDDEDLGKIRRAVKKGIGDAQREARERR